MTTIYAALGLEAEMQTAARVAKLVFDSGPARVDRPAGDTVAFIRRHVYKPQYPVEAASAAKAA